MIRITTAIKRRKILQVGQKVKLINHLQKNELYEPDMGYTGIVKRFSKLTDDFAQDTLVEWDNFYVVGSNKWWTSSACLEVIDD